MRRALLVLALLVTPAAAAPVTEVHYVMGTLYRITAEASARPAMRRCFQDARRLEEVFSRFLPESELSAVNREAGRPRRVSPDFARLLRASERLRDATDGRFILGLGTQVKAHNERRYSVKFDHPGSRHLVGPCELETGDVLPVDLIERGVPLRLVSPGIGQPVLRLALRAHQPLIWHLCRDDLTGCACAGDDERDSASAQSHGAPPRLAR